MHEERIAQLRATLPWPVQELEMRHFIVTTEGPDRLGLLDLCQRFADARWTGDHMTAEQAAESVLDEFKRAVTQELELLHAECAEPEPPRDERPKC